MKPMIRYYVKNKRTKTAYAGPYQAEDEAVDHLMNSEQYVDEVDIHKLRVHPTFAPLPGWCVAPDGRPYDVFPRAKRRMQEAQSNHAFYYTLYPQFTKKQTTKADRRQLRNISKQSRKVNYG